MTNYDEASRVALMPTGEAKTLARLDYILREDNETLSFVAEKINAAQDILSQFARDYRLFTTEDDEYNDMPDEYLLGDAQGLLNEANSLLDNEV